MRFNSTFDPSRIKGLDAIRRSDVRPCRVDECTKVRRGRLQLRGLRSKGSVLRQRLRQVLPFNKSFLQDDFQCLQRHDTWFEFLEGFATLKLDVHRA